MHRVGAARPPAGGRSPDRRQLAGGVAVVIALALAACGPGQISERTVEEAIERAAAEQGVDVDIDGEDLRITSTEGELSFRSGGDLPDGLPDDVWLPADDEVSNIAELTQDDGVAITVQVSTSEELEAVADQYEASLPQAGWTVYTTERRDDFAMLGARQGARNLLVNVTPATSGAGSTVTVNHIAPAE